MYNSEEEYQEAMNAEAEHEMEMEIAQGEAAAAEAESEWGFKKTISPIQKKVAEAAEKMKVIEQKEEESFFKEPETIEMSERNDEQGVSFHLAGKVMSAAADAGRALGKMADSMINVQEAMVKTAKNSMWLEYVNWKEYQKQTRREREILYADVLALTRRSSVY